MTPQVDHAELKRLADGATPGPWEWDEVMNPFYNDPEGRSCGGDGTGMAEFFQTDANGETIFDDKGEVRGVLPWKFNNAAFMAAANPAVVLALLSEIEGLKAELESAKINEDIWSDIAEERRTRPPDSWRPDREVVAREILQAFRDFDECRAAGDQIIQNTADRILALRPQTAESGK